MNLQDRMQFAMQCTRFFNGSKPQNPKFMLKELIDSLDNDLVADVYGTGTYLQDFEAEIAKLLGKESAVFMLSGTMAQQCALRIMATRKGCSNILMHPRGHLEVHENHAYQHLHNLHGIIAGSIDRQLNLSDLEAVKEPLAALLLELPQRDIGGQLPGWEDLKAMTQWARDKKYYLHMDGARLWESAPYYQKTFAEIASLFDTVYVSFYKGLGAMSGAALAGPEDLIEEARIWQHRHGGRLFTQFPYILSARKGLQGKLSKMADYHQQAKIFAQVLGEFPQISINPNPPHTNMMHVYIRGEKEKLENSAKRIAETEGIFMFHNLRETPVPGTYMFELTVKDPGLDWEKDEIRTLVQRWLAG